jgi:hypothetical protein
MKTLKRVVYVFAFTVMANNLWAGEIILQQDFNLMVYGADIIGNASGITLDSDLTPWVNVDGKLDIPENPVTKPTINNGNLGPGFFDTSSINVTTGNGPKSDSYKERRGLIGNWEGLNVFEAPKYIMFAYKAGNGWLLTPPLNISGTEPKHVKVSFKLGKRSGANYNGTGVTVSVTGPGTMMYSGTPDANITPATLVEEGKGINFANLSTGWMAREVTILNATSESRIKFESSVYEDNKRQFGLDDLVVETIEEDPGESNITPVSSGNENEVLVYTNRSDNGLYFNSTKAIDKVDIIGLSGGIALEVNAPTQNVVSLSGLPSGVYIARFTTQNKGVVNKKVVK